ncbi:MAG: acetylglutamate kinase [Oscillospiraceae bacterium]|nr:acetylglutamate kinase [Oscillospiraceae bacterium]
MNHIDNNTRTQILNEALPYIQEYYGKVVVVKYGGAAMLDDELKQAVMSDIVLLSLCGVKIVLVHGGGPEINSVLEKVGKVPKFINGLRYTDKETVDIVQMVLCGKVNKDLVDLLHSHKGKAIGLCGLDNGLLKAKQFSSELGFVGEITEMNPEIIFDALNNGYIPVIATVAGSAESAHANPASPGGESSNIVYNINADTAASRIAYEMEASNLILMTDTSGVLEDVNSPDSIIRNIKVNEVIDLKNEGIITGGMVPKIDCCVEAVRRGVGKTNIIDGRIPHSILLELLTDLGTGTMITKGY